MWRCGQVHFCLEFPWNLTSRHMAAVYTRNRGADERIRGHARVRTCQRRKKGERTCVREGRRKMRTEKRDSATRDLREGTCFAIGCAARRRWDYWKCNFAYDTRPTEEAELRVHADVFNAWPSYRLECIPMTLQRRA